MTLPIHIALVIDSYEMPNWSFLALEKTLSLPNVELKAIMLNHNNESNHTQHAYIF